MPLDTAALWELGWLREQGVLTEEEFGEQKTKVLHQQWVLRGDESASPKRTPEIAYHEQPQQLEHSSADPYIAYQHSKAVSYGAPSPQRTPRQSSMRQRPTKAIWEEMQRVEAQQQEDAAREQERRTRQTRQAQQEKQRQQDEQRRVDEQRKAEQEQQRQLEEQRRAAALRQRQEQQRQERERLEHERGEQEKLEEERIYEEEQQRQQRQRWREQEEERRQQQQQPPQQRQYSAPHLVDSTTYSAHGGQRSPSAGGSARSSRPQSARGRTMTPPPSVAVPNSPDAPGSASPSLSAPQTARSATSISSARRHAGLTPRSRSFDRPTQRQQMLASSSTTSPLRSPSPMASPPTPRFGLTFGPDSTASPATVRKAEGQLRLDVHAAAQLARKQLTRVEHLIPVAEEASSQAIAATQIAASALRANPTLKTSATSAAAYQRDAVRHALRALASSGDSSTYSMERRVAELQQCAEQLLGSVQELEHFVPSFQRAGEHGMLTPGTLSTDHAFPVNSDTVTSLATPSVGEPHERVRQGMAEAVHRAHANVKAAQEVCKHAMQQLRIVRSDLITSRGQVQMAQARMASENLTRARYDPRANTISPKKGRPSTIEWAVGSPGAADVGPKATRPVTGDGPRWPRSSHSPPQRKPSPSTWSRR